MPKPRPQPGNRKVSRRFLILCEGEKGKSENAYFAAMVRDGKNPGGRIKVMDWKRHTPGDLITHLKKTRESADDIVWAVFDHDSYAGHAQAFRRARENAIKIAFSAICFEYWILLHYKKTTRAFSRCGDLIRHLSEEAGFDYKKNDIGLYDRTKSLMYIARRNAKDCRRMVAEGCRADTPIHEFNPYTDIDVLIDALENFRNET